MFTHEIILPVSCCPLRHALKGVKSSDCASVGRVVDSDIRGLRVKASHQTLIYCQLC